MKIAFINPNSTASMTADIVRSARAALPGADIVGLTNDKGPPAIQGREDGDAAIPGLLSLIPQAQAQGADALVIACFDDTGLEEARAAASCPVLGIGQSSYVMAHLLGMRFSVITSLAVSIPVIENNVRDGGFAGHCASVRASGLPVLTIERAEPTTIARIAEEIELAIRHDGGRCVVLGCAGMAPLRETLAARTGVPIIDGVAAAATLAQAVVTGMALQPR